MAMRGAILVVEDEPAIQELIAVNLEHAGHQVLREANVPEARWYFQGTCVGFLNSTATKILRNS